MSTDEQWTKSCLRHLSYFTIYFIIPGFNLQYLLVAIVLRRLYSVLVLKIRNKTIKERSEKFQQHKFDLTTCNKFITFILRVTWRHRYKSLYKKLINQFNIDICVN